MSTPEIIWKLTKELEEGIATEAQVVYLLVGLRKLLERDEIKEQYKDLTFHCDWVVHSDLKGATAQEILRKFDAAHAILAKDKQIGLPDLPKDLRVEIERISKMRSFEEELSRVLEIYGLPSLTEKRPDGWPHFLHLYTKVVQDIPLVVRDTTPNGPNNISQVIVHIQEKALQNEMFF